MDDKNVGNWRFAAGTDAEVGGAWVQQHTRMIADGMKTIGIEPEDYFILPRHAWAGTWSHSAALWSGDIVSTFDELKMQVTTAQGTMMSGPVLWTTDIGGYHGGTPSNPEFQDLIVSLHASLITIYSPSLEKKLQARIGMPEGSLSKRASPGFPLQKDLSLFV